MSDSSEQPLVTVFRYRTAHNIQATCKEVVKYAQVTKTQQSIHLLRLTSFNGRLEVVKGLITLDGSGRAQHICDWWRLEPNSLSQFRAGLIGDTDRPQDFTAMSFSDLTYSGKWGYNRVQSLRIL